MPQLREYTNTENLRPTLNPQTAVNAGNAALAATRVKAAATEQLGNVIGGGIKDLGEQYQDYRAQQEISHGLATGAEVQANLTTAWNNYAKQADPNDPAVADRFREEQVEPILQAYLSGFETKRAKAWAEAQVGALRQHFFEKTAADQSTLAGRAAVQNIQTFQAAASNSAANDPSSVNFLLGTADTAVEAILKANPNLTVAQQAQISGELKTNLRKEIVTAGFQGMARANPTAAMEAIAKGYGATEIDATDRDRMFGYAEAIKRSQEADARTAENQRIQAAKREGDAFLTQSYAKGIQPDGTWQPPPGYFQAVTEAATKNPEAFDAAEIRSVVAAGEHAQTLAINKTLQRSDPNVYERFRSDINHLDKTAVNQAYADGQLSTDDWRMFLTAAEDAKSNPAKAHLNERMNEFFSGIKSTITKSNPFAMQIYPEQDQKYYEFQSMVRTTINWAVEKQGMSPDEAAFTYLDPRGSKYLGTLAVKQQLLTGQTWSGYQLSPEQQDAVEMREGNAPVVAPAGLTGGAAPRKAGESPEQYLKRTGG